jgi:hypothetical protein
MTGVEKACRSMSVDIGLPLVLVQITIAAENTTVQVRLVLHEHTEQSTSRVFFSERGENVEYQVVRTTMFPGLLKTLQHNKASSFTAGFKLFQSSDVVLANVHSCVVAETIVGAKNARRVCAVYAGPMSGFEIIHGLINRIMPLTKVAPDSAMADEGKFRVSQEGWCG